jgi:cell division protein FtsI (penicillin-binding protein 3)
MRNRYRLGGLLLVMTLLFAAVAAKLVYIQGVSSGRYVALGNAQAISTVVLPGERGSIFDRDGNELAISIPQTTIWADPLLVTDPTQEAATLAPVLGLDPTALEGKLRSSSQFVYLARKVDDATAAKVKNLNQAGIYSVPESKRFLPDGDLAAPVLGAVGTDNTGLSGLEQQYDKILSGRSGKLVEEHDPAGSQIAGALHDYQAPARGQDLVLTIDQSLQYATEQALSAEIVATKAKGGMALVMDSKTGELRAVADLTTAPPPAMPPGTTAPTPAPAPVPVPASSATAFTNVYEPGSVNKLVTISAALQQGTITSAEHFSVPYSTKVADGLFTDAEHHPTENWTTTDILANSSNVGTIGIAQKLGKTALNQYLHKFGFGQVSAVNFPGESAGLLLNPAKWSGTSIATVAIGQGVAVTAVQMLAAYNTIANGGIYVAPKLVAATIDDKGRQHPTPPSARHQVVSPSVARDMTAMLSQVVAVGTGTEAAINGYTVAGKTGTARIPLDGARGYKDGVYASSFAGFVPAEQPALTGIVILDETAQFGATSAAPAFASIARYGLQEFEVPPNAAIPLPPGVPAASPVAQDEGSGETVPPPSQRTTATPLTTPTTAGAQTNTTVAPTTAANTTTSTAPHHGGTTTAPRTTTTTAPPQVSATVPPTATTRPTTPRTTTPPSTASPPTTAPATTTPTTSPLKR